MSGSRQRLLSLESLDMFKSPLGQSLDRISVSSAERRTRWISKLEEIETKLGETELINSDLNQMRAELNRKIIELEKAQKPLIEENRKLQGRNKNLQQEIKKLEQQLSHTKDDFFTMQSHQPIPCVGQSLKMLGRKEEDTYIARVKFLESQVDELREEIAASKNHNELLEFQVLEMEETTNGTKNLCGCLTDPVCKNRNNDELLFLKNRCLELEQRLAVHQNEKKTSEKLFEKVETTELIKKLEEEKEKLVEIEKTTEKLNEALRNLKLLVEKLEKNNSDLASKKNILEKENEVLKEQIRPIKTELERRYEETKYKLSIALDKVHMYENMEKDRKNDTQNEGKWRELEEYNIHLENQVSAQTEMIDLLKNKLKEQHYFNELIAQFKEEGKTSSENVNLFQEIENKKNGIQA